MRWAIMSIKWRISYRGLSQLFSSSLFFWADLEGIDGRDIFSSRQEKRKRREEKGGIREIGGIGGFSLDGRFFWAVLGLMEYPQPVFEGRVLGNKLYEQRIGQGQL